MTAAAQNPVTPADAAKFTKYIRLWQTKLGLTDWRICPSAKAARKGLMAQVVREFPQRLARYRLGPDFGTTPVTDRELERSAVHELLHLHTIELIEVAQMEGVTATVLDAAEHRLINVLEMLLVPDEGENDANTPT